MKNVLLIARYQFQDILREPLVLLIVGFISFILVLNSAACAITIPLIDDDSGYLNDPFFTRGMSNPISHMSQMLAVLSMFIGVLTIAEEKARGSLKVLLTKPLYLRDIFAGKFFGMSMLLLIFIVTLVMLNVSAVIIFSRGPLSAEEFLLRVPSYIVVLFLYCELILGISMLIGVMFKKLLSILIFAGTFFCLDWCFVPPAFLAGIAGYVTPSILYKIIITGGYQGNLFRTQYPYSMLLDGALPYIAVMVVEILLVFVITSYLFTRSEV